MSAHQYHTLGVRASVCARARVCVRHGFRYLRFIILDNLG